MVKYSVFMDVDRIDNQGRIFRKIGLPSFTQKLGVPQKIGKTTFCQFELTFDINQAKTQ